MVSFLESNEPWTSLITDNLLLLQIYTTETIIFLPPLEVFLVLSAFPPNLPWPSFHHEEVVPFQLSISLVPPVSSFPRQAAVPAKLLPFPPFHVPSSRLPVISPALGVVSPAPLAVVFLPATGQLPLQPELQPRCIFDEESQAPRHNMTLSISD